MSLLPWALIVAFLAGDAVTAPTNTTSLQWPTGFDWPMGPGWPWTDNYPACAMECFHEMESLSGCQSGNLTCYSASAEWLMLQTPKCSFWYLSDGQSCKMVDFQGK